MAGTDQLPAYTRLRIHLRTVRELALRGNIPAARMLVDDVMRDLDDIQRLIDERETGSETADGD